ncbi:hypothetical protein BDF22DRAFT_744099 [Syncephalis plumigaleata]|nr:hypothetical protein BDF22DRAFT_744099 [Syncephalis plumigaleata]
MVFTGKEFGSGAASGLFAANATSTGAAEKGLASAGSDDSMFTRQVTPSNAAYNNSGMGNASSSIAAGAVAAAAAATVAHSHTPGFLHHTTSINRAPSPGNAAAMSGQSSPYGAGARALPPLPTLEIREHRTTSPPPLQISGPVWSPNGSPKPATASSMSNSTTTLDSEPATPHRLRLSNVNARRVSDSYSDLPSPMNNGGHTALRIHTEIEEERVGMDSDDESETDSSQSERSKLPVPESPLTRRLSARKNKRLSYNMGDSFDPTIASAVAAASRIESGEDPSTSSAMTPTLSQMAAAVLNARSSDDLEPLDPPRRSVDASSVASSAPSHFFSPRGPLTAVNEESGDGAEAGSSAPLRDQAEPVDRSTTLSKLMSDNFNPELMFGIPANSNAPRAGRSYSNTTGDEDEDGTENGGSRSRSNRRGSSATIATRFEEPRTPSFVRRDSAFFPQDF